MSNELFIVTGAAGHLGSTLVKMLRKHHLPVRALLLSGDEKAAIRIQKLGAEVFLGNMCDKNSLRPLFANAGGQAITVLHCAGLISIATQNDRQMHDVNVGGTKNLLELCRANRVHRLVYVSSVHAIPELRNGKPVIETTEFSPEIIHGPYAKTKAEATRMVLQSAAVGLNASVVHPSGILGPGDHGQGALTGMAVEYLNGRLPAGVHGGYDFVDVRDVAAGILSCARNGKAGECYILSGHYCTIKELLNLLSDISGKPPIKYYAPMWAARLVAPLSEASAKWKKRPPLFTPYSLYTLNTHERFSHAKATAELNYHPRSLRETVADLVDYLQLHKRF